MFYNSFYLRCFADVFVMLFIKDSLRVMIQHQTNVFSNQLY